MRTTRGSRPIALLACLGFVAGAAAELPREVSYQGRLTDADGGPLVGAVDLEVRVFDRASEGQRLYRELHQNVALADGGVFSLLLGTGDFQEPLGAFGGELFEAADRWLEVVVDGEVLAPRQPFSSVAYALRAGDAQTVGQIPAASIVTDTTLDVSFAANVAEVSESQIPDTIVRQGALSEEAALRDSADQNLQAQIDSLPAQTPVLSLVRRRFESTGVTGGAGLTFVTTGCHSGEFVTGGGCECTGTDPSLVESGFRNGNFGWSCACDLSPGQFTIVSEAACARVLQSACGLCADRKRGYFLEDTGTAACRELDGDEHLCDQAWHCRNGIRAACRYEAASGECSSCSPFVQGCTNACAQ